MKVPFTLTTAIILFLRATGFAASSPGERVVTFTDVKNENEGIKAEHAWTRKHFPDYRWKRVRLVQDAQLRVYDRVTLVSDTGEKATIYFDITNWRGHR
jgi:hypothetical protein